jgi:hypothetical protein
LTARSKEFAGDADLLMPTVSAAHYDGTPDGWRRFMTDALFWYTGLLTWALVVFVAILVIDAHDRLVLRRRREI